MATLIDESAQRYRQVLEHDDAVQTVHWSSGDLVATGCHDGMVNLFNSQTGGLDAILSGHEDDVLSVAWSPAFDVLASGSADCTVRVWNTRNHSEICVLEGHQQAVRTVTWDDHGSHLASGSTDGTVKIWSVPAGLLVNTLSVGEAVFALSWSPCARPYIACGGEDGTLRVYHIKSSDVLQEFQLDGMCLCVAWSTDATMMAAGSSQGKIYVWDDSGDALHAIHGHTDWVTSIAWHGPFLASAAFASDSTVKVWNVETERLVKTLSGHKRGVCGISWNKAGDHLVSGSMDTTARIWDVSEIHSASEEKQALVDGHEDSVRCCRWSPDGDYIASGGDDHAVRVFDVISQDRVLKFDEHGDWVTSVRLDCPLSEKQSVVLNTNSPPVQVCWSPDSRRIATASGDKSIRVFDSKSGAQMMTLDGHTDWVQVGTAQNSAVSSLLWRPSLLFNAASVRFICSVLLGHHLGTRWRLVLLTRILRCASGTQSRARTNTS